MYSLFGGHVPPRYSAWGGIQLGGMTVAGQAHLGMVELYPNTFGGDGFGPVDAAYRPWNFSKFPADVR